MKEEKLDARAGGGEEGWKSSKMRGGVFLAREFSCLEPPPCATTAEALSSLLGNEPWIKPLVLEPLNASLIQRAMLRVLAGRPHQGTNDSTPPAPQFQCWSTAKDSCKGNNVRS